MRTTMRFVDQSNVCRRGQFHIREQAPLLPCPHAPAVLVPSQVSVDARTRSNDGKLTPCFNDWKRFCFVLREIASGENGIQSPTGRM
jgi:hypothetical protein